MPTFDSSGVSIHYETFGAGDPILLVHGFASSLQRNWINTNWIDFLTKHGYQVIGFDLRGHGASAKLYDAAQYGPANMAQDALNLLDHLRVAPCDVMGYSMGARVTLHLALHHAARLRRVVLGGVGDDILGARTSSVQPQQIADAFLSDAPEQIADPISRYFRSFAERTQNDLRALAAVILRSRETLERAAVRGITLPVLLVLGEQDNIAVSAQQLAATLPHARLVNVPARDHLNVVGDQRYKDAVLAFLRAAHTT